ncbi:hypothetical protein DPMN_164618 [Dreissena polymorpha]|uniref:Uncharacterized protein n=1 Tax=Dreissena polymorpha TaxID=45954 RepID=A0A9D4EVD9_DREPO|nr:hypothetical protein DPMN_164618 [Dreissena polymorpha]
MPVTTENIFTLSLRECSLNAPKCANFEQLATEVELYAGQPHFFQVAFVKKLRKSPRPIPTSVPVPSSALACSKRYQSGLRRYYRP